MGTKLEEMRDGCFYRALDNEPMFVLLARDPQAPALVQQWAHQRKTEIDAGKRPASDMDQVTEARRCSARMQIWRQENDGAWRDGRLALESVPSHVDLIQCEGPGCVHSLGACTNPVNRAMPTGRLRYTSHGKEILMNGRHVGDADSDIRADLIVEALNKLEAAQS